MLTRDGVTTDKFGRDVKLATQLTDLVLEEFAQRLDQLQAVTGHETLGNTANVVVGLDSLGRSLE
jgi:hypothetical protein